MGYEEVWEFVETIIFSAKERQSPRIRGTHTVTFSIY